MTMYVEPSAPPMPMNSSVGENPYVAQPVYTQPVVYIQPQQQQQPVYYSAPYYIQTQPQYKQNSNAHTSANQGFLTGLLAGLCCCLMAAEVVD